MEKCGSRTLFSLKSYGIFNYFIKFNIGFQMVAETQFEKLIYLF